MFELLGMGVFDLVGILVIGLLIKLWIECCKVKEWFLLSMVIMLIDVLGGDIWLICNEFEDIICDLLDSVGRVLE